jgi:hypothetical protein
MDLNHDIVASGVFFVVSCLIYSVVVWECLRFFERQGTLGHTLELAKWPFSTKEVARHTGGSSGAMNAEKFKGSRWGCVSALGARRKERGKFAHKGRLKRRKQRQPFPAAVIHRT